ncbi:MarC family protein [Dechloromonas sp. ZS-1]|uniref:MarC family protein n=1 Tax=Dechloromonas sp. ZS-1 TaxID=3138067 RepID=UPI0031FD2DC7
MTPEILSSVFLLLLVLDPLGNVPFVLSLLREQTPAQKRRIILRECAIATAVLVAFLFVGDWLLAVMRLSDPALEISGGLILFLIALRMVFPPAGHNLAEAEPRPAPFIVPLAVPMIAGPSALAMVLLASRQSGDPLPWVGAVLLASAVNTGILLISDPLARILGRSGLEAMERLMGLILTTMAVQMLISGLKVAFATA